MLFLCKYSTNFLANSSRNCRKEISDQRGRSNERKKERGKNVKIIHFRKAVGKPFDIRAVKGESRHWGHFSISIRLAWSPGANQFIWLKTKTKQTWNWKTERRKIQWDTRTTVKRQGESERKGETTNRNDERQQSAVAQCIQMHHDDWSHFCLLFEIRKLRFGKYITDGDYVVWVDFVFFFSLFSVQLFLVNIEMILTRCGFVWKRRNRNEMCISLVDCCWSVGGSVGYVLAW